MPKPEPKCSTCEHCTIFVLIDETNGYCHAVDGGDIVDPQADTAPAWCPLRKEKGE